MSNFKHKQRSTPKFVKFLGRRSPLRKIVVHASKRWLAWRYRNFSPDRGASSYVRVAGLKLLLNSTVFDPRLHFTSRFLAEYLRNAGVVSSADRVLDVGTGSGLLAITAALAGARHVTAVDLNPEAVTVAHSSSSMYGLGGKVDVVLGDMFEPVRGQQFDLIVCNPPYLKGEPTSHGMLGYMAGDDFEWLRRFAATAQDYLAPEGGCLIVLADSTDLATIMRIIREQEWQVRLVATRDVLVERLFIVELRRPGDAT